MFFMLEATIVRSTQSNQSVNLKKFSVFPEVAKINFLIKRLICQLYLNRTELFDRFRLSNYRRVNDHGFSIYFWECFEDHHQGNNFGEE